jgi:hypothetical protein
LRLTTVKKLKNFSKPVFDRFNFFIPKPVWAVGFALEQTLHDATLTVFSYVNFKVASAYNRYQIFFI